MKVTVVGSGFVGQTTAMRVLREGSRGRLPDRHHRGQAAGPGARPQAGRPVEGYEPLDRRHERLRRDRRLRHRRDHGRVPSSAGDEPDGSPRRRTPRSCATWWATWCRARPDAILIVVSNPLDEMTFLAAEASGFPTGTGDGHGRRAGLRATAILHRRGARGLAHVVEAITLGSHGDSMVALPRHATVDGKPLPELVDEPDARAAVPTDARRRRGDRRPAEEGERVLRPQRFGRRQMVKAIAGDTKEVLPVCAWTTGQYGISDVYVGVPARLGARAWRRSSSWI